MAGFLGATLTNSSVDGALGYATTEIGPRWRQRRPVAINRKQTLLVKLAIAAVASPILTGILLLVAAAALGMHAPHVGYLWLLLTLAAMMIAAGTLALFAAFGAIGQALALILFVYLSLASSGGTVPSEALPGFFRVVGRRRAAAPVARRHPRDPLLRRARRRRLDAGGDRDRGRARVLARGRSDRDRPGMTDKRLYRLAPDLLAYVEQAVDRRPRPVPEGADADATLSSWQADP